MTRGIIGAVMLAIMSCTPAEESPADACSAEALVAQCPVGSNPLVGVMAENQCEGEGLVSADGGGASGVCYGAAGCRVLCRFQAPCRCGVASLTRDGVVCADCDGAASCGNGLCEGGESPQTCPIDCGPQCEPDTRRCVGEVLEVCTLQGRLEQIECPAGEICRGGDCQRDDRIIMGEGGAGGDGGAGGLPGGMRVVPGNADWPELADLSAAPIENLQVSSIEFRVQDGRGTPLVGAASNGAKWLVQTGLGEPVLELLGVHLAGLTQLDARGAFQSDLAWPQGISFLPTHWQDQRMVGQRPDAMREPMLVLFDRSTGELFETEPFIGRRVGPIAFSLDGRTVVASIVDPDTEDSEIVVWRPDDDTLRRLVPRSGLLPRDVAVSADGLVVAVSAWAQARQGEPTVAAENGAVSVWRVDDGGRIVSIRHPQGKPIWQVEFTADGRSLVLLYDAVLEVWSTDADPVERHALALANDYQSSLHLLNDGRTALTSTWVQNSRPETYIDQAWDLETGERIGEFEQPERRVLLERRSDVHVSPDGRRLTSSWTLNDREVHLRILSASE